MIFYVSNPEAQINALQLIKKQITLGYKFGVYDNIKKKILNYHKNTTTAQNFISFGNNKNLHIIELNKITVRIK